MGWVQSYAVESNVVLSSGSLKLLQRPWNGLQTEIEVLKLSSLLS